jgi:hypothetical protein
MKLKKLSLQKDTLLPLDAADAMNIAGGMLPVSSAPPLAAGVNACQSAVCTDVGPRCGTGTATCATCATNCGTCATCATNCGTCGTCATNCGCPPVTHLSDCRCPGTLALRNTCLC